MKILLRSTFVCRPEDDPDLLLRNFQHLKDSGLGMEIVEDNAIWQYVQDFVQQHHHVPDHTTVRSHFQTLGETTCDERIDALTMVAPKTRGDFKSLLEKKDRERKERQVIEILKEAGRIVSQGVTIKERTGDRILRGPEDAVRYILDQGHDVVTPTTGVRLSGEVTGDTANFLSEYERVENDPLAGIGQYCGIAQIDHAVRGAKRAELWTHAAFTGGLKSTFALNWMYNQAIYYRHSGLIFSLEMPYQQVRRLLVALHSAHPKFEAVRKKLGLGRSLEYQNIRDGELDYIPDEEWERLSEKERDAIGPNRRRPGRPEKVFLTKHVIPDLENPANEYGKMHIEVTDPNKADFTVADLQSKAELLYSKDPDISAIFVDHMGLMSPRHRHKSTTENLNEVVRDLKRLSMNFNKGLGIAVVGLFQISREGFKAAEKSDGRYNLTHLSYSNECERSSDIVTATYVDDTLRGKNEVRFQCLKSRDQKPFDPFIAGVHWPCRRIYTKHDVSQADARSAGEKIDRENLLDDVT